MKKIMVVVLIVALVISLVACTAAPAASSAAAAPASSAAAAPASSAAASSGAAAGQSGQPYIAMVSKGFQHPYWQQVLRGAKDASAKDNVQITFDGPPSESDISTQVDMLNADLAKNPAALCLAALDTSSVTQQLQTCVSKKIPVVGFDSGVVNPPAGSVYSTAATDNEAAGAVAADNMFKDAGVAAALKAATTDKPVVIASLNQDATSASITGRATGFVNEAVKLAEAISPGNVSVTGHDKWKKASTSGKTAIEIFVSVAASSSVPDCQTCAQAALQKSPVGIFVSNSGTVDGLLAATSDGSDLDRTSGKYKNIVVVGFDSGKSELNAITKGWFLGAITQDPYQIGYKAVDLCVQILAGKTVDKVVDTGCHFYDAKSMTDPAIAPLLYQ